jgi:hypothetical protein
METCLKCKKDISGSTEIEGTTYHAAAPSFLRVPEKKGPDPVEEGTPSLSGNEEFAAEGDYDFSDPDLDILVNESDDEGTITFGDSGPDGDGFLLEPDEEGSFEFDLDDEELGLSKDEHTASSALNVPGELADISDLAPPVEDESPAASVLDGMSLSLDDERSLDEDLGLDDLDLDLGLRGNNNAADADLSLSLDDIDLSPGDIVEENSELDEISMDFDLDGLQAGSAPEKEEPSGSLDGIFLSLD